MRVAVVGANGFVGGHVLRVLRAAGDEARAVVRGSPFSSDPDRRIADALDVYSLREAFAGCEYVVQTIIGPQDVILGSLAPMYAAAQAVGIKRILYMSTGVVHGQSPEPGATETSPLHVRHRFPYNNAKVRAERKLRRLRRRSTVEVVILRPTIVFGPGSRWIFEFASALRDQTAVLVDRGTGICNSIYVDNLAHAVRLALTAPGIDGEVFHVGDAETVTWAEFYRCLASGLGYDFDAVPSVSPPELKTGLEALYIEPIRTSELGQTIIAALPPVLQEGLRQTLRLARHVVRLGANREGERGAPTPTIPFISPEIIALHRCRWRFPQDKAIRLLGYVPPVPFAEGCRRSVEWLKQEGYA